MLYVSMGLPRWLSGKKNWPVRSGDMGYVSSVPGSRGSSEEEMATHPVSCVDPVNRGAWKIRVHRLQRARHDSATKHNNKHVSCLMDVIVPRRDHNYKCHIRKQQILQIFLSYERQ